MTIKTGVESEETSTEAQQGLARSAMLLSLGNVASRVLGLSREMVITYYFGASGAVSAFRIASQVPMLVYDFLVGGMLSAALVPTLSEYAHADRRTEFIRLVSTLLSLFTLLLALIFLALTVAAPWVANLLAPGFDEFDPALLFLTTQLIRLIAPAVWMFGMAGVLTATLYALRRFSFPALATAVYNLGIVVVTPLMAHSWGVTSLIFGILAGSLAQLLLMGWDLHYWQRFNTPQRFRFQIEWHHPALGKILRLYWPIAAGLIVSLFQVGLDRRLASGTGEQSIAWMQNATTLQQLPLGLISVAISLAALPRLSQYFAEQDEERYRKTLGRGLRMVLMLIIPAAVGLWLLGGPITRLIFERGKFTETDTIHVVQALNIYIVGMLFAAIDFPLNYAFYARNNTLWPALVGVFSVGVYIIVALWLLSPLGYLGLVWADSAKQASHALVMMGLLAWQVGRLGTEVGRGLLSILTAAGAMAGIVVLMSAIAPVPSDILGMIFHLGWVGGIGLIVYVLVLYRLKLPEIDQFYQTIRIRLIR